MKYRTSFPLAHKICSINDFGLLHTIFLTTNIFIKECFHLFSLLLDGWMHIASQSGGNIRMSEKFRKRFGIKPRFNTACGKGVTERVKGITLKSVPLEESLIPHIGGVRGLSVPVSRYISGDLRFVFR